MSESRKTVRFSFQADANTEGLERFRKEFENLNKSVPLAEASIRAAREDIRQFGEQNGQSAASVRAIIEALKSLERQAKQGGKSIQLVKEDLRGYVAVLDEIENGDQRRAAAAEAAATATRRAADATREADERARRLNQTLNDTPRNTFNGIAAQVGILREGIGDLNHRSDELINRLTKIRQLEIISGRRTAVNDVVANNQAYSSGTISGGYGSFGQMRELPNTIAADQLRVSETTKALQNLEEGTESYTRAMRELVQAQEALNQKQQQFATNSRTTEQITAERTRLTQAAAATGEQYTGALNQTYLQSLERDVQSRHSTYNANRDTGSAAVMEARDRRFQAELADFDARLTERRRASQEREAAERTRRERQRVNQRRLADTGQMFSAIAAGGLFGGPEAAIGAGIGGVIGGAPGAWAGSSIGLGASSARMAISGITDYSAQVDRLNIALKGVTQTQAEYSAALTAISRITADFNIPIADSTKGFTQLSASVIGAGGTVKEAEIVYRGLSSAIKATGGDTEALNGAILAATQVFGKGKVSAEELQGQIGERLPGAVAAFAKATGRTLPQLQKDLEQGVVGLNDFLKFNVQLIKDYSGGADSVAKSSQDAGARLQVALADMRVTIGRELQPIGAEIQESLVDALVKNGPTLIAVAKGLAGALKFVADNAEGIGQVAVALASFQVAKVAITGTAIAATAASAAFTATATTGTAAAVSTTAVGKAAAVASIGLNKARVAMVSLVAAWVPALVLTLAVKGLIDFLDAAGKAKAAIESLKAAQNAPVGEDFLTRTGGAAQSFEKRAQQAQQIAKDLEYQKARLRQAQAGLAEAESRVFGFGGAYKQKEDIKRFQAEIAAAEKQVQNLTTNYRAVVGDMSRKSPGAADANARGPFADPEGKKGKDKADAEARKAEAARQAALRQQEQNDAAQRRQDELRDRNLVNLADARWKHERDLARDLYEYQTQLDEMRFENFKNKFTTSGERDAAGFAGELAQGLIGLFKEIKSLNDGVTEAERTLKTARAMAAISERYFQLEASATSTPWGGGGDAAGKLLGAANKNLGLFAGQTERCADAIRKLFEEAGIAIGVTKKAWDGLPSGPRLASSFFGSDIGQRVSRKEDLRPGDLVGFDRTYGRWPAGVQTHVGMYAGGGMMYDHSSSKGLVKRSLETFPGKFLYGVRPEALQSATAAGGPSRPLPGSVAGQNRNIRDDGGVQIAEADLAAAKARRDALVKEVREKASLLVTGATQEFSAGIREENQALSDQIQELQTRNRLVAEGFDSRFIENEMQRIALTRDHNREITALTAAFENSAQALTKATGDEREGNNLRAIGNQIVSERNVLFAEQIAKLRKLRELELQEEPFNFRGSVRDGITGYIDSIGSLNDAVKNLTTGGISGLADAFTDLAITGKASFRDLTVSILQDTARMIIQQIVMVQVLKIVQAALGFNSPASASGIGSITSLAFSPGLQLGAGGAALSPQLFAKGDAFGANGIVPFAKGGIFDSPTLFRFAKGGRMETGVMGEASPEAVMPLTRGPDGSLGVKATGMGGGNTYQVSIAVDASGSPAQGDPAKAAALGRELKAAVDARILELKRPGGLLS